MQTKPDMRIITGLVPRLKTGSLILADNVLFHGQVLEKEVKEKVRKRSRLLMNMVNADDRVEKMMLTFRDGVYLIRKKINQC